VTLPCASSLRAVVFHEDDDSVIAVALRFNLSSELFCYRAKSERSFLDRRFILLLPGSSMFLRSATVYKAALVCGVLFLSACGSGAVTVPSSVASSGGTLHTSANGGPAAGAGGAAAGGGNAARGSGIAGTAQVIPGPSVDAAAFFVYNASVAIGNPAFPVNYDILQNMPIGGTAVGAQRTVELLIVNISKKQPLTFSQVAFAGPNASDFSVAPADIQTILATNLAANKGQGAIVNVVFTPTAPGIRTATLQVTTNAGVASVDLTGTGVIAQPVIALPATSTLSFLSASAPDTIIVGNNGGTSLTLSSIAITGPGAAAFQITNANSGQGNCFNGVPISLHQQCFIGVGLAVGAVGPATATLVILSNDPVQPETDFTLTL